jgi:hypothetical protein
LLKETSVLINRILFITSSNKYLPCCSLPTINWHFFIFFYLKKLQNCRKSQTLWSIYNICQLWLEWYIPSNYTVNRNKVRNYKNIRWSILKSLSLISKNETQNRYIIGQNQHCFPGENLSFRGFVIYLLNSFTNLQISSC